jgi:hypothetical protein
MTIWFIGGVIMRKSRVLIILALCAVVASAGAQVRFEIGAVAPAKIGFITGDGSTYGSTLDLVETLGIIPIGNLGLFLESDLGILKLGIGAKIQTLLVASAAYPAVQAELAMGPVFVDMSIGGYFIAYYAIGNVFGVQNIEIVFPDASVWLGLGKNRNVRLGGGVVGAVPISFDLTEIPFIAYAGLKVVL